MMIGIFSTLITIIDCLIENGNDHFKYDPSSFFKSLKVADKILIGATLAFVISVLYGSLYGITENSLIVGVLFLGLYAAIVVFFVIPIILVDFVCWLFNPKRFGKFFINHNGSLVTVSGVAMSIVMMILLCVVVSHDIPMKVGFFLAKSGLKTIAALDNPETAVDEWVGPWKIHEVKKTADGELYIRVTGDDVVEGNFAGIAYKGYTEKSSDSPFGEVIYVPVTSDREWSAMYFNRD